MNNKQLKVYEELVKEADTFVQKWDERDFKSSEVKEYQKDCEKIVDLFKENIDKTVLNPYARDEITVFMNNFSVRDWDPWFSDGIRQAHDIWAVNTIVANYNSYLKDVDKTLDNALDVFTIKNEDLLDPYNTEVYSITSWATEEIDNFLRRNSYVNSDEDIKRFKEVRNCLEFISSGRKMVEMAYTTDALKNNAEKILNETYIRSCVALSQAKDLLDELPEKQQILERTM